MSRPQAKNSARAATRPSQPEETAQKQRDLQRQQDHHDAAKQEAQDEPKAKNRCRPPRKSVPARRCQRSICPSPASRPTWR
jgi:hypothetical protein